jgi:glutaconate CoA-transferase subunit A
MSIDKEIALEDLPGLIPSGAMVGLGGGWFANHPMAAVRQILRAGRQDIHALALVGSIDVDLLVGANALTHLTFSMVTLEAMGLAVNLRRSVQSGSLSVTEISALALQVALEAGAHNVPFYPLRGPTGSDLVALNPDFYASAESPFDGERTMVVRALKPDVAIVHARRCDRLGNAQYEGSMIYDPQLAASASCVIVTCEELVSSEQIARNADLTKIPGYLVDAVVEVPFGAHPCSHVPLYAVDAWQMLEYQKAALAGGEHFAEYLERLRGESEGDYRERALGRERERVLAALADCGVVLESR